MKKIFMIGSMILLSSQAGYGSWFESASVDSDNALGAVEVDYSDEGGDGDNILEALGKKPEDYKAVFDRAGVSFWKLDDFNPFAAKLTKAEIEKQNNSDAKTIIKKYKETGAKLNNEDRLNPVVSDAKRALIELKKDTRALEQRVYVAPNARLKQELQKIVDIAEKAIHTFNQDIKKSSKNSVSNEYMEDAKTKSIEDLLKKAQEALLKARRNQNSVDEEIYKDVIKNLNSMQAQVKDLIEENDTIEEAIEQAEKLSQSTGKVILYDLVKAQLKLQKNKIEKEDQVKEAKNANVKNYKKQVYDEVNIILNNPIESLKKAEVELQKAQLEFEGARKSHGATSKSRAFLTAQQKVKDWQIVVDELKIEVASFEIKVNDKLGEILRKSEGDKKKALESLLSKSSKRTSFQYVQSFVFSQSTQKELINQITDAVEKEVAKRLVLQIKEESLDDPLAAAKARLAGSKSFEETMSAYDAIVAAYLAKGGISLEKLPARVQASLQDLLQKSSQDLIDISNNKKLSEVAKAKKKQELSEQSVLSVVQLLSPHIISVDYEVVKKGFQSGDILSVGLNFANNQLINKLSV